MAIRLRPMLVIGVVSWGLAVALTPGEVAAAKAKRPIDARTVATMMAYLAAAVLVLQGLAPKEE
jgi:hypothetical protein